jgi:hypothetical protein
VVFVLVFSYNRFLNLILAFQTGEHEFLDVWHESYAAIMRYARGSDGFWVIKSLFYCTLVLIIAAVPECEHPYR